jgi:hypothetical protein
MVGWQPGHRPWYGVFFLVKRDTSVFFVTAAHVVNGWQCTTMQTDTDLPNYLYLRFTNYEHKYEWLKIYTGEIQKEAIRQPCYIIPDLFIARISLPRNFLVESVDDFMNVNYSMVKPGECFYYGFPGRNSIMTDEILRRAPTETTGKPIGSTQIPIGFWGDDHVADRINTVFRMDSDAIQGYSGAPIFLRDAGGSAYFGGIEIAIRPDSIQTIAVRPDSIVRRIRERAQSIPYLSLLDPNASLIETH